MRIKSYMPKVACMMLAILFFIQVGSSEVSAAAYWPEAPETVSPAVILMELSTGTVLYEKNSTEAHYPASITKIMTTLVALENSDLNEVVTFSDRAIDETYGSGIARDYGEQMTMEQCLYAVMLESANECAFAVAEHVGGTMENFVDMMNAKAKELGCQNTHFANPNGLQDENHYTCAADMALIAQAAYENETFRIITGTKIYTIPPTNKHPNEETILRNHHDMLCTYHSANAKYLYEYCVGGKTGYTEAANSTLVTYAEKDGMTLVCVVMNVQSPGQFQDTLSLFQYAFDNFQLFNVADNETNYDTSQAIEVGSLNEYKSFVELDEDANIVLPKTAEFSDAVSEISYNDDAGSVVGTISYTYGDHEVGKADIVQNGVEVEGFVFDNQESTTESSEESSTIHINPMLVVLIILAVAILALLVFFAKKIIDNYYIIRHNMEVRKSRRDQFRAINKRQKRRRRRK